MLIEFEQVVVNGMIVGTLVKCVKIKWVKELGPYYELRNKVLKMLTTEYWYSQIEKKYIEYNEMIDRNNNSIIIVIILHII